MRSLPIAPGMRGMDLGAVVRPYDRKGVDGYRQPLHRLDDSITYMRTDKAGTVMVLAECGKHYARQSQADLLAGIAAPCDRSHDRGGRNLL